MQFCSIIPTTVNSDCSGASPYELRRQSSSTVGRVLEGIDRLTEINSVLSTPLHLDAER